MSARRVVPEQRSWGQNKQFIKHSEVCGNNWPDIPYL